jgi:hypothetical protein
MPRHEAEQFNFPFLSDFYPGDEVWVTPKETDKFEAFRGRVISVETKQDTEKKLIVEDETTGMHTGKDWMVVIVYPNQCKFIDKK